MAYYYGIPATAVWLWDDSATAYVDLTHDVSRLESITRDGLGEDSDYLYIGFERRFDAVLLWLEQTGQYTQLKWEFSSSKTVSDIINDWKPFELTQPRKYTFGTSIDYVRWNVDHPLFSNWVAGIFPDTNPRDDTVSGIDVPDETELRYWIRISARDEVVVSTSGAPTTSIDTSLILSGGVVNEVIVSDGGAGYTTDNILVVNTSTGTGAQLGVGRVSHTGEILEINVLRGGSGYEISDTVGIQGETSTGITVSPSRLVYDANNYAITQTVTVSVAAGTLDTPSDQPIQLSLMATGGGYNNVSLQVPVQIGGTTGPIAPSVPMDTRRLVAMPSTLHISAGSMETFELALSFTPTSVQNRVVLDAISIRPYAYAATPEDVQAQLQLETEFDDESIPEYNTVEKFIRGAEDGIYHITYHYFRPEFVDEEMLNFEPYGMTLRHSPILDILQVAVHNGDFFEEKFEGRNQDWHYEPYTGMIYISTLFLDVIPPQLRRGYSERRNQGAYKRSVRVRYIHGHNLTTDPFSVEIGRIVTKKACIDIISNQDFQRLLPQGLDRVQLQEKIRIWTDEVTAFTDRYSKLRMF